MQTLKRNERSGTVKERGTVWERTVLIGEWTLNSLNKTVLAGTGRFWMKPLKMENERLGSRMECFNLGTNSLTSISNSAYFRLSTLLYIQRHCAKKSEKKGEGVEFYWILYMLPFQSGVNGVKINHVHLRTCICDLSLHTIITYLLLFKQNSFFIYKYSAVIVGPVLITLSP